MTKKKVVPESSWILSTLMPCSSMFSMLRCITFLTFSTFWFTALSLSILLGSSYFLHASSSNFLHLLFKYPSFLSAGTLPLFAGNWQLKSSVKEDKRPLRAGAFNSGQNCAKTTTYTFLTLIEADRCASLRIWRSTEKEINESIVIFNKSWRKCQWSGNRDTSKAAFHRSQTCEMIYHEAVHRRWNMGSNNQLSCFSCEVLLDRCQVNLFIFRVMSSEYSLPLHESCHAHEVNISTRSHLKSRSTIWSRAENGGAGLVWDEGL